MSYGHKVEDGLDIYNLTTLRGVESEGQYTFESQSVEPDGYGCCQMGLTQIGRAVHSAVRTLLEKERVG